MSQQRFDPSSKWMLEERGASLLWLAGVRGVLSVRARKAEVVQPRQLPDGLLDVFFAGIKEPRLVLVEVATYPEPRLVEQMCDDLRLVRQARGVLPDALALCLCPKGRYRVPDHATARSVMGWSGETFNWKVVELWTLPAEELLEAPDVGVVPWATLGKLDGPPEMLLQRCRDRIDREGGDQRESLLAVSQMFAILHFDKPDLLSILGGRKMFMDNPLLIEVVGENTVEVMARTIASFLKGRFGSPGERIKAGLKQVKEVKRLDRLVAVAATCRDLPAFEAALLAELPQPELPSTRRRKKQAE